MASNLPVLNRRRRQLIASAAFSPASLFAASEPGAWYDPSDLTTMFQDTAGTTPVTATGQTVALLLDKSQGLVLGPELVSNSGPFSNTTGYTAFQGTLAASGGNLVATATVANDTRTAVQIPVVIGAYYRVTVVVAAADAGTVSVGANFTTGSIIFTQSVVGSSASSGTITILAVATNTFMNVVLRNTGLAIGQSFSISSVSAKELPGNHATQATAASRPIYGIEPFGGRRNLLERTEEFSNAYWTKTNITLTSGVTDPNDGTSAFTFTASAANGSVSRAVGILAIGSTISAFVRRRTGSGAVQMWDGNSYNNITVTGSWLRVTVSQEVLSGGFWDMRLTVSGDAVDVAFPQAEVGAITPYQRVTDQWNVTQAGVPSVSYLAFDGTDDFMLTGTITPGIDKAQVFAGVRKLVSTVAIVCEASPNVSNNSGAFYLSAGLDAGGTGGGNKDGYVATARGNAAITSLQAGQVLIAAPDTAVLAATHDIPGDLSTLRRNGVDGANGTADKGTGNFLAYPLYIGRRGGTSAPFNGRIYSLTVRFGANLSAAQISQMETWVAGKTGVTI